MLLEYQTLKKSKGGGRPSRHSFYKSAPGSGLDKQQIIRFIFDTSWLTRPPTILRINLNLKNKFIR